MHGSYLKADHSIDFVLKMLSKWVSTIHGSVNAFILPRQKHWGDIRSKSDLETSIVPLLAIVWQIWLGIFFFLCWILYWISNDKKEDVLSRPPLWRHKLFFCISLHLILFLLWFSHLHFHMPLVWLQVGNYA